MKMNLLAWHSVPEYPGAQLHEYLLTPSLQLPPFKQGILAHSLISEEIERILKLLFSFHCDY